MADNGEGGNSRTATGSVSVTLTPDTLKTPLGILKIVLFFITLLGFAVVASFQCNIGGFTLDYSDADRADYYMGIMVIGWLLSIAFLLIYVLFYEPVTKGLPFNYYILPDNVRWGRSESRIIASLVYLLLYKITFAELSITATWSFLSLLAGAFIADDVKDAEDTVKQFTEEDCTPFGELKFGAAAAIFACFLWGANAVLCFLEFRKGNGGGVKTTTTVHNPDGTTTVVTE